MTGFCIYLRYSFWLFSKSKLRSGKHIFEDICDVRINFAANKHKYIPIKHITKILLQILPVPLGKALFPNNFLHQSALIILPKLLITEQWMSK